MSDRVIKPCIKFLYSNSGLSMRNVDTIQPTIMSYSDILLRGKRGDLVVERRTLEREVGGSIFTQVAVLYP